MVRVLLALLLLLPVAPAAAQRGQDTTTYASPATRVLVERAASRHRQQDSLVTDYRATLRYRLTFAVGRRRWARMPPLGVEEQEALVAWQLPNDLRVDFLGQRSRSRSGDSNLNSGFSTPWFVPRQLGDSVRIFGQEFPERAALHPLAADGPDWYRYTLADSVGITLPSGEALTLLMLEFVPRRTGPALIVGRMWVDRASAEVVRLSFQYVGTDLWTVPEGNTRRDTTAARRENALINRVLSVSGDLEYARQDGRYWMPYRQVLSGQVQVPIISDIVVPFEAVTTFADYAINTGEPVTFRLPLDTLRLTRAEREARRDSLRNERRDARDSDATPRPDTARTWAGTLAQGGRFEMRRPPRDSLRAYEGWGDSLAFDLSANEARRLRETLADLERLASRLPGSMTGRPAAGFNLERLTDLVRYNRVQGLSLGAGYQVRVPGTAFDQLFGTVRYGLSDGRPGARLSYVHDAPAGRLTVAGFRQVQGVDPLMRGDELANTVRALFAARDENDYVLATGGRATWETSLGLGTELTLWSGYEHQRSIRTQARSAINDFFGGDGRFLPNGPATTGHFGVGGIRIDGGLATRTRWSLSVDGQAGEGTATGRAWGRLEHRFGRRNAPTLRLAGGSATRATVDQMAFRVGGGRTVRGHDFGAQRGQAFWMAQLEVPTGRRWHHPVLILDAGQAGHLRGPGGIADRPVLIGAGVAFRLVGNLMRVGRVEPLAPRP